MNEAVVDEKTEDQKDASGTLDAQEDDLDSLLSQWDEDPEPKPEPDKTAKDDLRESLEWIRQEKERSIQEQTSRDIDAAVQVIHKEMGETLSEKAVRRMLNGAAGEDARLRTAWMNRHQNRTGYEKVLKALAKDFSSELAAIPDKNITEDREAVSAAVRGASTKVSDEPDIPANIASMSDQEFEQWVRKQKK